MEIKGKVVMISGASAGIGASMAKYFAAAGTKLILIARRREKLTELVDYIENRFKHRPYMITGSITNYNFLKCEIGNLPEEFRSIDILINNAGKAKGLDKFHEARLEHWEEMIDTNIKGLLYLSRLVIPGMVERGKGHAINIGSIAGFEVYPNGHVYCATKFAVKALSKGMTIDLNGTGVRVSEIDPGLVETEFSEVRFDGDAERAAGIYKGYKPLSGDDIAEIALFIATRPDHVMIQNLIVTPSAQASATIVKKDV